MKTSNIDWSVLRGSLSTLIICLIISAGMLFGSFYYRDEMRTEFTKEDQRFKNVSRKYLAVDQEEKMILLHYPRFKYLYQQGVIGKEQRLRWLETLRTSSDELKLPSLRYNIDSRESFTPSFPANQGLYQIYTSSMKLDLGLLHENDLLLLLNDLEQKANGLYSVSSCNLQRKEKSITRDIDRAKLDAKCELLWFTIDMAGKEIVL